MKRFWVLLLVACMMMTGAAEASSGDFMGHWYGILVQSGKVQSIMEHAGLESSLLFAEDKTVQWAMNERILEGEWQYSPDADRMDLSIVGMEFSVTRYSEDKLAMDLGTQIMILAREKEDPFAFLQLTNASGPEAFSGNWVAVYMEMDGFYVLLGDAEQPVAGLVIDGETASFVYAIGEYVSEQYDAEYRFEDGKLKASSVKITLKPAKMKIGGTMKKDLKEIKEFKASEIIDAIKKGETYYGLKYIMKMPQLKKSRKFYVTLAYESPDGYLMVDKADSLTFDRVNNGYQTLTVFTGEAFFGYLYKLIEDIPKGTYKVHLFWDGMKVQTKTFKVN